MGKEITKIKLDNNENDNIAETKSDLEIEIKNIESDFNKTLTTKSCNSSNTKLNENINIDTNHENNLNFDNENSAINNDQNDVKEIIKIKSDNNENDNIAETKSDLEIEIKNIESDFNK